MFIITLGNLDRFSEFFYKWIREKILYVHITEISTSDAIRCYVFTLNATNADNWYV